MLVTNISFAQETMFVKSLDNIPKGWVVLSKQNDLSGWHYMIQNLNNAQKGAVVMVADSKIIPSGWVIISSENDISGWHYKIQNLNESNPPPKPPLPNKQESSPTQTTINQKVEKHKVGIPWEVPKETGGIEIGKIRNESKSTRTGVQINPSNYNKDFPPKSTASAEKELSEKKKSKDEKKINISESDFKEIDDFDSNYFYQTNYKATYIWGIDSEGRNEYIYNGVDSKNIEILIHDVENLNKTIKIYLSYVDEKNVYKRIKITNDVTNIVAKRAKMWSTDKIYGHLARYLVYN